MGRLFVAVLALLCGMTGELLAETRQLQGVIVEESGKPVAGAELFLYGSNNTRRPADYISPKTGADGRFVMKVPSGAYWGVARLRHSDKYGPLLSGDLHSGEPVEIDLSSGQREVSFTVSDIREMSRAKEKRRSDITRVQGRVDDQHGRPVASATVYLWREPYGDRLPDVMSSWTGSGGEYYLYLPSGRYSALASTSFPPLISEGRMVKMTIEEGQKSVALNLQVIKMEDETTNIPVSVPSGGMLLDDE